MVDAATTKVKIPSVNDGFHARYARVASALARMRIPNPIPYGDLWDWWQRCKAGDLPSYQSRRLHVTEVFGPLEERIRTGRPVPFETTGWVRVDHTVDEIRETLAAATSPEQFQAVGLLCREAIISLAQAVYRPARHPSTDGTKPSSTDAARMLTDYISVEFEGNANGDARKHVKSALGLALSLQHKRTADFKVAAMCVEATGSTINIIAIMAGGRDPTKRLRGGRASLPMSSKVMWMDSRLSL